MTAFQDVLRLLPASITPSNEILLIGTLKSGFDLDEE